MVTYGFPRGHLKTDLALAKQIGATNVEVLPDWRASPDPLQLRQTLQDQNVTLHSAHGCWGGQSILATRVDLGHPDLETWQQSLDDLRRCLDWLAGAGGTHLVVHPGGLSDPESLLIRRRSLLLGLLALADHAKGTTLRI